MTSCKNYPEQNKIYILNGEQPPRVHECNRKNNGEYLCSGFINGGVWKLSENDNGCHWFHCKYPFKNNNGKIDYSDYSQCKITNFPYYLIQKNDDGNKCQVNNIFEDEPVERSCEGGVDCCTDGKICDYADCMQYKNLDKYLLADSLDYKCSGASCEKVAPGTGDFGDPFCGYECSAREYPKVFTCINGVCSKITDEYKKSNPKAKYHDNIFCDLECPSPEKVTYNCNLEFQKCDAVTDGSGEYADYDSCSRICNPQDETPPGEESEPATASTKKIYKILGIILLNIFLVILIIWFISRSRKK